MHIFRILSIAHYVSVISSLFTRFPFKNTHKNLPTYIHPCPTPPTTPPFFHDDDEKDSLPNINGFFAMIGPNSISHRLSIPLSSLSLSLFDLFTGDGVIQGIFFHNHSLYSTNQYILTEKLIHELHFGKLPTNIWLLPFMLILHWLRVLPNILGVSNTAILKVKDKTYSLFERDLPYLVDINIPSKTIRTVQKQPIHGMRCVSGHSKYHSEIDEISSIEYDYMCQTVGLYKLDTNFSVLAHKTINVEYLPITHDYLVYGNYSECMLFCDSPFVIKGNNLWKGQIPIVLDHRRPTYIHTYNFTDGKHEKYKISDNGYYIFHFSKVEITNDGKLEIYGSLYDKLDFNSIDIQGKYRKIEISLLDKEKNAIIYENSEVETYNLDFPVSWNDTIILRNIETVNNESRINGFLLMDGLNVKHELLYDNLSFSGEPAICYDDKGEPYLISLAYNETTGFAILINLNKFEMIKKELLRKPTIGFHSIFING